MTRTQFYLLLEYIRAVASKPDDAHADLLDSLRASFQSFDEEPQ